MITLSNEARRVLEVLDTPSEIPEDRLPEGYDWALLPHLVASGRVKKFSILPPGREPDYPNGLWAYQLSSSGREVLNQLRDEAEKETKQNRKQKRRAVWNEVKFWVGLLVGWVLGGVTPEEVFQWVAKLFH